MTIGYLLDLLIINEVRKEKLAAELDIDVKNDTRISVRSFDY